MKEYGGVEEQFQIFLILAIDRREKLSDDLTFRSTNISRHP
jgi:hypothetical protein